MDISPYLSAIQSLKGQNPSEKYKELHSSVKQLIVPSKEKGIEAAVSASQLPVALHPFIRILLGNTLKSREEVIEALKSEDVTVRNQALKAKWFFNGSDDTLNAYFFVKNVMPFVSAKTQRKIIKTLSINLTKKIEVGDNFYHTFLELYGYEKVSPLLAVSTEETIVKKIFNDEIRFTRREMHKLFRIHPQLIVRYFREGFSDKKDKKINLWSHDRKYKKFLPYFIKNYPNDFFELCNAFYNDINVGSELQRYLLDNHVDALIERPETFLKIFTIQAITENLTDQQFQNFYINLYKCKVCEIKSILEYLEYYPKEKRLTLLQKAYKVKNNSELLDDIEYIKSYEFLAILSLNERQNIGRKIVNATPRTLDSYFRWCCYLPPEEAFNIFKKEIIHSSDANHRLKFFKRMIHCCVLNNDKEYLLDFLNFYDERHKNERAQILHEVFRCIGNEVPANFLNKSHWEILRKLILRSYIKKELFAFETEKLFLSALYHLLVQCKDESTEPETQKFLNEIVDFILEYCIKHQFGILVYIPGPLNVTKQCFKVLLDALPLKYPDQHEIWQGGKKKINYAVQILVLINQLNKIFSSKKNESKIDKLTILDYPWLVEMARSVLLSRNDKRSDDYKSFENLIKQMEPAFYNSFVSTNMETDECPPVSIAEEIKSGAILKLLRTNPEKIYNDWTEYLKACQEIIKHMRTPSLPIRRFIRITKWHQTLPLNFVKHCSQDLSNPTNLIILGLLLEGEILSIILWQLIPEVPKINTDDIGNSKLYEIISKIPVAIDVANPPVNLLIFERFFRGDFVHLAARSVIKVSQRIPLPKAKSFAKQLITKPVSVQRYGYFMFLRFADKDEHCEFLTDALKNLKHPSMHNIVVKKILHLFGTSPYQATWELMKACIATLTADDQELLEDVCKNNRYYNLNNEFAGLFYIELFYHIEKLAQAGTWNESDKNSYLNNILCAIARANRIKGLPDEECKDILNRYLLNADFINNLIKQRIYNYYLNFALNSYLWETPDKFEYRWNVVSQFLSIAVKYWNVKDSKDPKKYPARLAVCKFFKELFIHFKKHAPNWERRSESIGLMLNVFSTILSPWQEISSYLILYFFNLYLDNMSWKDYGLKCGENIVILAEKFSGVLILDKIDECLHYILECFSPNEKFDNLYNIMQGLCEINNRYTALTCIKLLKKIGYDSLDGNFLNIIDCLNTNDDIAVKSILNDFINKTFNC